MRIDPKPSRPTARRLAAVATVAVTALGLAACTAGSTGTATGSGSATPAQLLTTTPKAAGPVSNLVWDLPQGEPTTLDYVKAGDYSPDMVISNLCDSLLRLNPDFTIGPNLASSWKVSDDKLTITFTIRSDVKFWDGTPLTAADVAYSLNRNLDPKNEPINGAFYSNVTSIKASGPSTVVLTFKAPDELILKELATVAGTVSEKAFTEKAGTRYGSAQGGVMCSGPFKLDSWSAGKNILLSANSSYWNPDWKALPQHVELRFVTDSSALVQALKSGEIDGAYEVPSGQTPALTGISTGTLYQGKSLQLMELTMNAPGPMTDPKIRQALSMSIDRAGLAKAIYHDTADANYTLLPPTSWDPSAVGVYQSAFDALKKPALDLEAAKTLLSGNPNASKTIVMAVPAGNQTAIDTATYLQQSATAIGLKMDIKQLQPLEMSSVFYDPNARKGLDILLTQGFLDVADPLDYLGLIVYKDSLFNWLGYDNPQVADLATKARSNFDDTARAKQITEAQALYEPDQVVIPMLSLHELLFMNKKITGAPASFAYIFEPSLALVGASS